GGVGPMDVLSADKRIAWQLKNAWNLRNSVPLPGSSTFTLSAGMKSLQTQIPYRSATLYAPTGALYPCRRTMGFAYLTRLPSIENAACQREAGNFLSEPSLTKRLQ